MFYNGYILEQATHKGGLVARFISLTIAAVAVVLSVHSGSPTLALAALCGAGGVASFAHEVVDSR